MLVIVSDLHFTDATAGKHNLPSEAFQEVFLSDIIELARKKRAKELKLLLLGDIPDLIRSEQWLTVPPANRPWGQNGLDDVKNWHIFSHRRTTTPTEAACLRILGRMPASGKKEDVPSDTILYQNWETFSFFRDFRRRVKARLRHRLGTIPVSIIFVPGNHDRLVNLYPSVRDTWQEIMDLTINSETVAGDPDGDWWYPYEYLDEAYGLYARHGHQYDVWNYGGGNDLTRRVAHLQVPIGDVFSTEFAVRIPWEAAKREDVLGSELVARLQDMDNVRPLSRLLEWFYYEIEQRSQQRQIRRVLDEIADNVVRDLLDIDFVRRWRTPLSGWDNALRRISWLPAGLADRVEGLPLPGPDEAVRTVANPPMRWLADKVLRLTDTDTLLRLSLLFIGGDSNSHTPNEEDVYVQAAYRDHIWRSNDKIRFIAYGHTHRPGVLALDGANGHDVLHLNSGTWRERIQRTVSLDRQADFIKLKQMSYIALYRADEDGGWQGGNKKPDSLSFDMWTGTKLKYYKD
jgi:UDP-2,3-diacylglucosamine pyrophosphatase LpxH